MPLLPLSQSYRGGASYHWPRFTLNTSQAKRFAGPQAPLGICLSVCLHTQNWPCFCLCTLFSCHTVSALLSSPRKRKKEKDIFFCNVLFFSVHYVIHLHSCITSLFFKHQFMITIDRAIEIITLHFTNIH